MKRGTIVNLLMCSALLCTTVIPALGVVGLVALVLVTMRLRQRAPTRRVQLGWILAALPSPLSVAAVVVAPLLLWERVVLALGLLMQWVPMHEELRWGVVIAVATIPAILPQSRLKVNAFVPLLQMAATIAWPAGWDVVVCTGAAAWCVLRWVGDRREGLWWVIALLLCGLNSSAAIAVLPWVLVCALAPLALYEAWSWWAVLATLASGGYGVVAGLLFVPMVSALQRVNWRVPRAGVLVLLLWCVVPVTSSVARLQTSLSLYGTLYGGTALAFADSSQRVVAQLPWFVVLLLGVLLWAATMQWHNEEQHE